jgi:hypothetical protein
LEFLLHDTLDGEEIGLALMPDFVVDYKFVESEAYLRNHQAN